MNIPSLPVCLLGCTAAITISSIARLPLPPIQKDLFQMLQRRPPQYAICTGWTPELRGQLVQHPLAIIAIALYYERNRPRRARQNASVEDDSGVIQAVFFDFDGLLVDSEPAHFEAYHRVLRLYGVDFSEEEFAREWTCLGAGPSEVIEKYRLPLKVDILRRQKNQVFEKVLRKAIRPMPFAGRCTGSLKNAGFRLGVVTGSRRCDVAAILKRLGLWDRFEVYVCRGTGEMKPSPGPFLRAAALFRVETSSCLAIEDAPKGAMAATAAGMRCVVVLNRYTRPAVFGSGVTRIRSLGELTPGFVRNLEKAPSAASK